MIAKLVCPERNIYWDNILDKVEHTLNNTVHRAIGQHPSVMLFGVGQRGKVSDLLAESLSDTVFVRSQGNHQEIREKASERQRRLQDYNKSYVDERRRPPNRYSVDDYVMIKNFDSHAGVSKKLKPKFKGPYRVSKVLGNDRYVLEDIEGFQQSRNPYTGIWAVGNMRPWLKGRSP